MSKRVLDGARLPWPTPWNEVFGRQAPLLIEIGFGGGHFLLNLAQKRPDANILGVEIAQPSLQRVEKKIRQAGQSHVSLVQADAQFALWVLCAANTVNALYINFPDPWPKPNHHHRRLINDRFLHLVATRLTLHAHLDIATDHDEYAAVIADCLAQAPYFRSRAGIPFMTQNPGDVRTKYETIAQAEGRVCYYFKWQRNDVVTPDLFPIPQELPMPHVILCSPLSLAEISRRFAPQRIAVETANIRFLELFQSLHDGKLLVEAYVHEGPVQQRIGLIIRSRGQGEWIVGLHDIGFPRPTPGIHAAVYHLAQWLLSLHPDSKPVHSNLQEAYFT